MTLLLRPRTTAAVPPPTAQFAVRVMPFDAVTLRGKPIRLAVEFVAADTGALADPSSVTLQHTAPGASASLTYPGGIARDGPGRYHADVGAPDAGSHAYRWSAPGVADLPFFELLVLPRST
jgi:hypothetical protein